MKYFLSLWHHSNHDNPIWMAYEVDQKGNILRRIERFSSGYFKFDAISGDDVSLSDIEFDMNWIDVCDPEFTIVFLNEEEFERLVEITKTRI